MGFFESYLHKGCCYSCPALKGGANEGPRVSNDNNQVGIFSKSVRAMAVVIPTLP
jgi:hypothetical protein